jgi:4-hydroxybenzoate polyprenyltransferase
MQKLTLLFYNCDGDSDALTRPLTLEGDLKVGNPTLAATNGVRIAAAVGILFLLISTITSPVLYLFGVSAIAYLLVVAVWILSATYIALVRARALLDVRTHLMMCASYLPYPIGVTGAVYALAVAVWAF